MHTDYQYFYYFLNAFNEHVGNDKKGPFEDYGLLLSHNIFFNFPIFPV